MSGDFAQLLSRIAEEAEKKTGGALVVAIDGRAAAGKSSLAASLGTRLGLDPIHMDDFFLPEDLRTEDRLREPGGNVHYERFAAEVLPLLPTEDAFSYRRFDCRRMDYGLPIFVRAGRIRLVEGAYSLHPYYGDYADLKIFYDIDPVLQAKRIRKRNGPEGLERFKTRWIPMEENYLANCRTHPHADLVLYARDCPVWTGEYRDEMRLVP